MYATFYDDLKQFLNENWYHRVKYLAVFLGKLSDIKVIKSTTKIVDVTSKSKYLKNFVEVLEDASTFNINKMNTSGLIFKTVSKNKKLYQFFNHNAEAIEKGLLGFSKFGKSINNIEPFLKKFSSLAQKTGTILVLVDIGFKAYGNYSATKSIKHTIVGTFIDYVGDLNMIDGLVLGSNFGVHGAIGGVLLGGAIQLTNFLAPNLKNDLKQSVFNWLDGEKIKSDITNKNEFAIDSQVLNERINFYKKLIEKLNKCVEVIVMFEKKFNELSSGSVSTITKNQLISFKNKVKYILETHIEITLKQLLQQAEFANEIFSKQYALNSHFKNNISIEKFILTALIIDVHKAIYTYQDAIAMLDHHLYYEKNILHNLVANLSNEKYKLKNLNLKITEMERMNFYE